MTIAKSKKHSDLIAIANADLAERLNRQQQINKIESSNPLSDGNRSFKRDIWKAVYTLNIIRYALGIAFLALWIAPAIDSDWNSIKQFMHPRLFFISTILLLCSAVVFSYVSKYKEVGFNVLITTQFSLDLLLAALLTHSAGSVDSNFALLYLLVVATGSVVLPRKQALGLAAAAIILMFCEHLYSVWGFNMRIEPNYPLLTRYGLALFAAALLISYLAERIRIAELSKFVPGNETIEDFLVREETTALKTALQTTAGNKTEAAKLLGMSFRSFRYKLTKYDID